MLFVVVRLVGWLLFCLFVCLFGFVGFVVVWGGVMGGGGCGVCVCLFVYPGL